ncbi:MAG TPA: hypothetical protein PKY82_01795 [Pyrinomonadaceae bacterium]|nr:hypothetical protein [Pyrinomonadaceae bacterium]
MKKINLILTILVVLIFCGLVWAQSAQPAPDPDLKAINEATLTVKGKLFPKIKMLNTKKTSEIQNCCNIGETRNITAMDIYDQAEGVYPQGKVTFETTHVYSPPQTCWVISSYNWSETSNSHATRSLTAMPGNYTFVTSNQYQKTYEDLKNLVLNMNILGKYKVNLIAKLELFTKNYSDYTQSISVSNPSIALYVKLESKGWKKGRSWLEGKAYTTETCCPPEIRDAVALKTTLTNWVNDTVNKLPNKGKGFLTPTDKVTVNPLEVKDGKIKP